MVTIRDTRNTNCHCERGFARFTAEGGEASMKRGGGVKYPSSGRGSQRPIIKHLSVLKAHCFIGSGAQSISGSFKDQLRSGATQLTRDILLCSLTNSNRLSVSFEPELCLPSLSHVFWLSFGGSLLTSRDDVRQ